MNNRDRMKLFVEEKCAQWFGEEIGFRPQAGIRFKTKIYASSPIMEGFGIAIESVEPQAPIAQYQAENGLLFFVEEQDAWFFQDYDLEVHLDSHFKEPVYTYLKEGQVIASGGSSC